MVVSYGAAIEATGGWGPYDEAVRAHQRYITTIDSFRSPIRPDLIHVFDDFFIRPYRAPIVNALVTALVAISLIYSLVQRRPSVLIAVATFGPFCLAAWLLLDFLSVSRFSIGYAPLFAILAADGTTLVSTVARDRKRSAVVEVGLSAFLCAVMIAWTIPALTLTSRQTSPPVQAIDWIRSHVRPGSTVYVERRSMGPYAEWYLPDYRYEWVREGPPVATLHPTPSVYLREEVSTLPGALNFTWPHARAWNVARRRYFDVSVTRLTGTARFDDGWYPEEGDGHSPWRWLARRGSVVLPPITGSARLKLRIFAPLHVLQGAPLITIRMNGAVMQQFSLTQPSRDVTIDVAPHGAPTLLEIETNRTVNPQREKFGADARDLGLRVDRLDWIALGE